MNRTVQSVRAAVTAVVVVAAVAVGVVATLTMLTDGEPVHVGWLLSVAAIVIASAAPLYLERYDDWLVVGIESCVLVFLSLTLDWAPALVLWTIGVVLAHLLPFPRGRSMFAAALSIVCGAIAVAIVSAFDTSTFGPREVLAVVLGFTAAFVVDVLISVVRVDPAALPGGGTVAARAYEWLTLYAIYVGVNAIGYASVLLFRNEPAWALLAVLPALAIVLVAVRGVTRERETARRLNVMFETASTLHSASTEAEVLTALDAGTRQLGKVTGAGLRSELPAPGDLRRLFISGDDVWWLVIPRSGGPSASTLRNREALESIAQQAEEALSRMRMNRELVANAERDPLTKLSNRSVFMNAVDEAIRAGAEDGGEQCVILFCDLDGFKRVNDQYGHACGDAALVEVAQRLSSEVPAGAQVARLGGDEFAILVRPSQQGPVSPLERAAAVAGDVRTALSRPIDVDSRSVEITASIGIAAVGDALETATELLRNADIAMYAAKASGRDRAVVYCAAMGVERMRSLELVDRLRRAIDERRLRVVYQPIVAAADERLVAVEALARWTEDGEVVAPEEFIPLAEEANLIEALGALVLEQVCDDLEQLEQAFAPTTAVAVNLSARQLDSPEFVRRVHRAIEAMAPRPLTLEITETESTSEEVIEARVMEGLIERGAVIAVDDFGVGFSSLERLMRFPVQVLKLDRIFSHEVDTDEGRAAFLGSMLEMATASRMRVVVEGIERQAQVEAVLARVRPEALDALAFQGYLFGGPMSPATMVRWAAQRARTAPLRRS